MAWERKRKEGEAKAKNQCVAKTKTSGVLISVRVQLQSRESQGLETPEKEARHPRLGGIVVLVISHYQLLLLEFICQTKHAENKAEPWEARSHGKKMRRRVGHRRTGCHSWISNNVEHFDFVHGAVPCNAIRCDWGRTSFAPLCSVRCRDSIPWCLACQNPMKDV